MKKVLFGALMLASALLIGCKQNNGGGSGSDDGLVRFEIRPTTITLAEGYAQTLTVVKEPGNIKVDVEFSSSNTDVCTVTADGEVYGVSKGTATVTAKDKISNKEAQCQVTVTSYIESFNFDQVCCYNYEVPAGADTFEIEAGGTTYYCQRANVDFWVFSEGFHINESGNFDGTEEPIMITIPCKMIVAPRDLNGGQGTIFCLGEWMVNADSAAMGYTMTGYPGEYNAEFVDNMLDAFTAYNEQDYNGFYNYMDAAGDAVKASGAYLEQMYYTCAEDDPTNCGYSMAYVPSAIVVDALFDISSGRDGSSPYMIPLDYWNFTFRQLAGEFWGFDAEYDEEADQITVNGRDITLTEPVRMEGGTPASVGRRMVAMPVLAKDYPEIAKQLKKYVRRPGATQLQAK